MVPWPSPGHVLRWWRTDVLGLTQHEAAERLSVQSSALSNWERGTRAISIDFDHVDRSLGAGGVLAGLLWAHSTPRGLEPGHLWTKVFAGASAPVWVWIRSEAPALTVEAEWGVVRIDNPLELGPNGVFITAGASVPDSPVVIHLSEPGWADFGWGVLPPTVPGAGVVRAESVFQRSTADGPFMELFRSSLVAKLRSRSLDMLVVAQHAPKSIYSFFTGTRRTEQPAVGAPTLWPPRPEGIDVVERRRFARLRQAREVSLAELADRLASQTGIEASRDTLRRFEIDHGRPHDPMLPVALDHVLGADGRLAVLELRSASGSGTTNFPRFWRGPIWLELSPQHPPSTVVLERGKWQRQLDLHDTQLVSVHWFDPAVPLRIKADDGVRWRVGVGRQAGALPIDQNWAPATADVAEQAIIEVQDAMRTAIDRRRGEIDSHRGSPDPP